MDKSIIQSIYIAKYINSYLQNPQAGHSEELNAWLSQSDSHRRLFESLVQGDDICKALQKCESIDEELEWQLFYSKFKAKKRSYLLPHSRDNHLTWRLLWSAVAAAIIIPIIYIAVGTTGHNENNAERYQAYSGLNVKPATTKATIYYYKNELRCMTVPKGGKYSMTLEDGTRVWLNADSKIKYPTHFNKNKRIVEIEGEAFLDVTHDNSRPFYVKAGSVQVHVMGTAFNIRYLPKEHTTSVTLTRGRIRMEDSKGKVLAQLQPSRQFVMNDETHAYQVGTVDIEHQTAWKDGMFAFDNERIENIANELGRWYNVNIIVDNTLKGHRYSGTLSREQSIATIIRILKQTEELNFVTDHNNTIHIVPISKSK